jgi:hypothetical protein
MTDAPALALPTGPLARLDRAVTLDETALRRLRRTAVVGVVLLNLLDLAITRRLLGMGAVEGNPLMAPMIHGGWAVALKVGIPVAMAVRHLVVPLERRLVLAMSWMCVLYLGVVLWNLHMFDTLVAMR